MNMIDMLFIANILYVNGMGFLIWLLLKIGVL
jgi:hypothetical protein